MEAIDLVYEIEEQCEYFAKDIRARICNNIIEGLNKCSGLEGDDYDALGMTYFDKLAIKYQSCSLEEIGDGFDDIINEMIDIEYDNLSQSNAILWTTLVAQAEWSATSRLQSAKYWPTFVKSLTSTITPRSYRNM